MVDVTVEALQSVRDRLRDFDTDIASVVMEARRRSDEALEECRAELKKAERDTQDSAKRLQELEERLAMLELKIKRCEAEIEQLKQAREVQREKMFSLEKRIDQIYAQMSDVRVQIANAEDSAREMLQSQLNDLHRTALELSDKLADVKRSIADIDARSSELAAELNKTKKERDATEADRDREKRRYANLRDKEERMKWQMNAVEEIANEYLQAVNCFELRTSAEVGRKTNSLNQCISSIENYLSTAL